LLILIPFTWRRFVCIRQMSLLFSVDLVHCAGTIADREKLLEFAGLGGYCEWDLFGIETSHYMLNSGFDMPSDAQRIASIKSLVDAGFGDRVVIGHDIHTKHRLVCCICFYRIPWILCTGVMFKLQ